VITRVILSLSVEKTNKISIGWKLLGEK
jgi:hypothetical protein